jgi:hypothetical protein
MRTAICICGYLGVAATAGALPSNGEHCGSDDGHTIVVCGSAGKIHDTSGGSGSGSSHAGSGGHTGSSGSVRNRPSGGNGDSTQDRPPEAPRPLSNQTESCAACQAAYEFELFRGRSTRDGCLTASERMADDLCHRELLMPNGDAVDDFSCPADGGRCSGPGLERCVRAYRRGMRGVSVTEGHTGGFSVTFQVVVNGGASRTETSSWSPTNGYLMPCYDQERAIVAAAHNERTFCGRRVLAAQEGVCTF